MTALATAGAAGAGLVSAPAAPGGVDVVVELLNGRYYARGEQRGRDTEWPPDPFRVWCAFKDSSHDINGGSPAETLAVEWLETAGAPTIYASGPDRVSHRTHAVYAPVNPVRGTPNKTWDLQTGAREKQERHRGSVRPDNPVVRFRYPLPPEAVLAGLRSIAPRISRLGSTHTAALVTVQLTGGGTPEGYGHDDIYQPHQVGKFVMRVPRSGKTLQGADRRYAALETQTWTGDYGIPSQDQGYILGGRIQSTHPPLPPRAELWPFAFASKDDRRTLSVHSVDLTGMFRRALMAHTGGNPPRVLSGHNPDGSPSEGGRHISVVPLPNVGGVRSDGRVMGLGLVVPVDIPPDERRRVEDAITRWDADGAALRVSGGFAGLRRVAETRNPFPISAQAYRWTQKDTRWVTATPLALHRHPRRSQSVESVIAEQLKVEGWPEPETVRVSSNPLTAGAFPAGRYRQNGKRGKKFLVHAEIVWPVEVTGPVVVGGSRFQGLGLMLPASRDACRCPGPYCYHDPRTRAHLWEKQNRLCAGKCSARPVPFEDWQVDHREPQSLGGRHWADNLQGMCATCNQRKSNRPMADLLADNRRRTNKVRRNRNQIKKRNQAGNAGRKKVKR